MSILIVNVFWQANMSLGGGLHISQLPNLFMCFSGLSDPAARQVGQASVLSSAGG